MSKVCLLMIATNKYIKFVEPLWNSTKKHFLKDHEVKGLLFTNQTIDSTDDIKISQIDHEPWPMMTLKRYNFFLKEEGYILDNFDFVYYCDVDMLFVGDVGNEILPETETVVATCHPGFYNKPRFMWTYETRPESHACIPPDQGLMYVAGGFQGGSVGAYMKASNVIAKRVEEDLEKGIIAIWHDESHWNRYVTLDLKMDIKVLSPSYCYPESWNLPFGRKLLALDKNHSEIRNES